MQEKFIVPQFIDAEDKIWGPITVRQFVIILIGGFFSFIAYKLSDFALYIFWQVIIIIFVSLFAFYRVNGSPFHNFAVNVIETFKKPRLRVWHKEFIKVEERKGKGEGEEVEEKIPRKTPVSGRKLSELSLIIDTGGVYKGEKQANQENNMSYFSK